MTLDEARDRFERNADTHKACDYLAVAHKYWADGIISDETFSSVIDTTLGFIQETGPEPEQLAYTANVLGR